MVILVASLSISPCASGLLVNGCPVIKAFTGQLSMGFRNVTLM